MSEMVEGESQENHGANEMCGGIECETEGICVYYLFEEPEA